MMLSYHYAIEFAKEQKEVFGGDMGGFLDAAIECIEKQIPKNPIVDYRYKPKICPICHAFLENYQSFCDNCGQAIDWSDEDDI